MATHDFLTFVRCPKCKGELKQKKSHWICEPCHTSYPLVADTPWLFNQPETTLTQWRAKAAHAIQLMQIQAKSLESELNLPDLYPDTKARIKKMAKACTQNASALQKLLAPILTSNGESSSIDEAIREKVPTHQNISTYYSNVLRDWSWENEENTQALSIVSQLLPKSVDTLAVLGAGACRLAIDIHLKRNFKQSLVVDINPFLFLTAQALIKGDDVELYEFPIAPKTADDFAVKHELIRAPKVSNFHFLYADVTNLPLKNNSLDAALTPWLIDIIPQDFKDFAKRVNQPLRVGGYWINMGPLGFDHKLQSQCYGQEEVRKIIEDSGFEIEEMTTPTVAYLKSPHSNHSRNETLTCFRARKVKEVKEPKDYEYLPEWLANHDLPLPDLPDFTERRFKNKVHYEILASIDGQTSINKLVPLMCQHYKMTPDLAREALVSFLTQIHEESLRR